MRIRNSRKRRRTSRKCWRKEEQRFAETLDQGMEILEAAIADLDGKEIPGDVVFKLYDTYGFPVDLTADIARERGLSVDQAGFEVGDAGQRDRPEQRASSAPPVAMTIQDGREDGVPRLRGHRRLLRDRCTVQGWRSRSTHWPSATMAQLFSSATPFYARVGGQIGDKGILVAVTASCFAWTIRKKAAMPIVHFGTVEQGELKVGDKLEAVVDAERRQAIRLNHTATHLMHAALRNVLGDHVQAERLAGCARPSAL